MKAKITAHAGQPKRLWATFNALLGRGRKDRYRDPLPFTADDYLSAFTTKVLDVRKDTANSPPPVFPPTSFDLSTLAPVTATNLRGSFSPLLRNPASLTLFLHPCCRSLSMSFSHSSPSSATTPSVKELCLRPRSDPSWFLSSSARGWMREIQTTTGQLRTCLLYQRSLKRLLPSSLQRILMRITSLQRFSRVSERAIPLRPSFSAYSLTSSELSITAS